MITGVVSGQNAPTVTAISPRQGTPGTVVTITGTNFSATPDDNIVHLGATKAQITSATEEALEVIVPAGATEQITVTVNGLTAYAGFPFVVTFPFTGSIGGSFGDRQDFWAGYQAKGSTVCDLDDDGKTDIVVADQWNNVVSVFRNISSPGVISWDSFEGRIDFPTGSGPYSVASGDLDGDGKRDLVVTNANTSSISILQNTSTPGVISFASNLEIGVPPAPLAVAIRDLDLDGKPDIAVTNTNTLSILRNISSADAISSESFDQAVDLAAGNNGVWSVILQDVDGDGKPDITVTSGGNNAVSIFRNIAQPGSISTSSFQPRVDFETGSYPAMASVSDLDGDDKPDLVVGNCGGNTISIFRNIGSPGAINAASFDPRIDLISTGCPWNATVGDVNGDGKPDLLARDGDRGTISIFRNQSTEGTISSASFSQPYTIFTGGNSLVISIADMDGDGMADITLSNEGWNIISVFRNSNTFDPEGPSHLTFRNITSTSLTADFSASPDGPDGYIAIRRNGGAPDPPEDGTTYSVGQITGDDVVAYIGPATTFDDTELDSGAEYFYNVYAFYDDGESIDYVTGKWASGTAFTIGTDLGPIVSVSPSTFTLDDEITITFDATRSYPLNSLVGAENVYMYSGLVSEGPESGNWNLNHVNYTWMTPLGDNKWSVTFTPRYFYSSVPLDLTVYRIAMVFNDGGSRKGMSFDGDDIFIPVSPTVLVPPTALPATFVSSTGFEAEWNSVYDISTYYLDVSVVETFDTFVSGFEGKTVYGSGTIRSTVGGLLPDTDYFYRVRAEGIPGTSGVIPVKTRAEAPSSSPVISVTTHGGPGNDEVQSMTSDRRGNIYAAGHFSGTVTFGTVTLTSQGDFDIFLVRYNPRGELVWARAIGGAGRDNEVSLATDSRGLYMSGQFSGQIDLDPGTGTTQFSNDGEYYFSDGFLARYNLDDGSLVWARQLIDASGWSSSSIGVDRSGIYLTGHFYGTTDFDPGQGTAFLTAQYEDVFLAKYSLNGGHIWSQSMGGYYYDTAWGLLVDRTGIYIHGYYSWGNDFDPAFGYYTLEGEGGFFGRYNSDNGNLIYIKKIGNGTIYSLASYRNELYLGGDFYGVIDADPDDGTRLIGREGYSSGIVGKYNLLDGSFLWANCLVTTGFIGPRKLIAGVSGVYASGYFAGSTDFDASAGESNRTSVQIDAFVTTFSRINGDLLWAKAIGSPGYAVSIAATLTGAGYYLAGLYARTVDFNPSGDDVTRTSVEESPDIFVAKYEPIRRSMAARNGNETFVSAASEETLKLILYPNPTDKLLTIDLQGFDTEKPVDIIVTDLFGKKVLHRTLNTADKSLDVSELLAGYYIIQARQTGKRQMNRFIKN